MDGSAPVSHDALFTLLGTAAGMTLAAVSAFAWLIGFIIKLDQRQSDQRHRDKSEVLGAILSSEHELTRRIERLEDTSRGFQAWRRTTNGDHHGDG